MDDSELLTNNKYDDELEIKLDRVENLVEEKVISVEFGDFLKEYLIKKDVAETIRHSLESIIRNHSKRDNWFFIKSSKKRTTYM